MALVSEKDFMVALNMPVGTYRSLKSRKQIRCNVKKQIDTENTVNYMYLLKVNGGNQDVFNEYDLRSKNKANVNKNSIENQKSLQNFIKSKKEVVKPIKAIQKTKKVENKEVNDSKALVNIVQTVETKNIESKKEGLSVEEKRVITQQKKYNDMLLSFEIRKKEAEVVLKEREAELKQYELEKKAGNNLPLQQVESMILINHRAILKSCLSQSKNIAIMMVQQLGGTKEDQNFIMIELEQIYNRIVKQSKEKSNVEINKIIEEYSQINLNI